MLQKRGIITSAKMTGTVTVTVHRRKPHSLYRKSFRVSTKFLADPNGLELGVGDEVSIMECRPLSKRKRFKVSEVLVRAERVGEIVEEAGLQDAMHPSVPLNL
ncbi:30S ribosomal protein S17 [Candidatus Peribacteria bacterium RIFCSPLOWO2_12_FULL_55_15]|nr:MAG: 30S ribosomal protein S17 [Candidatus Peribacteria bacterium RIFCSPHIGHO2_01_FULL_54_22]OGJ63023.1 MAG: 30S ribosomal protein S17 [Candidatus Peribacteria bacterium RIFCSPHIGHO2_02_FULL_55_24]OGJ63927.1 MAG: 30S ribosomal protein S17 [Candidatus Peribacteria bacterium RIFCSPHIGHO2_12_FULL_54_10]OGJ68627.1 MAG: 30S ribosomal protein S17 [Candidatus Peribacteria bacterium RIFCSPLOWO2_01_FULL_54_110]OGJ68848.1 MAG: 30S ribosomal protein S17 [Candidatus Peribacteria bacterium RIFCSPLOWO2_02